MRYPFDTFVVGPLSMLAILVAGIILIKAAGIGAVDIKKPEN